MKKEMYAVTQIREKADGTGFMNNVFQFVEDPAQEISAKDRAIQKFYALMSTDCNSATYDYLECHIMDCNTEAIIKSDKRDSRPDVEPENETQN